MIRTIVAEEVRKQLPAVVSEMYLRKLVSEANEPDEPSWEDSFDAELQRRTQTIPEPMDNSDEGIYQGGGPIRRKNEAMIEDVGSNARTITSKLLGGDNDMSYLYEGVKPISQQTVGAAPQTDVQLEALGITPGKYKGIDLSGKSSPNRKMKQSAESEERRIAMLRASLDQKVG